MEKKLYGGFIVDIPVTDMAEYDTTTADIFDEDDSNITPIRITVGNKEFEYLPYGADNELPFKIRREVKGNMILSQNLLFNILTCYGQGVRFIDKKTNMPTENGKIGEFELFNSLNRFFLEQATDMKTHYFCVSVVILNQSGSKIVQLRHKEACFCRFARLIGEKDYNYVLYANWKDSRVPNKIEVIRLLDYINPIGDLMAYMGKAPDCETGLMRKKWKGDKKFAIVSRFPTPGNPRYPFAYWNSVLLDNWADIYRMIGVGKAAKLRNHTSLKYQVEIHDDYWDRLCEAENITDEIERKARIDKEKENIRDFLTGVSNSDKLWISGYYIDPNGKENHMVKINLIEQKKEGGDWADDIQEASNIQCYAMNVHPNLVGATPGKSQMNNSGSDKRELFTMKQALEKAYHDMMMSPFNVLLYYNGWYKDVKVDIPMITLTTLDKHKDAEEVSNNSSMKEDGKSDDK